MRLIWLVLAICSGGLGVIGYVAAWIVIPEEPLLLPQSTMVHQQNPPTTA